MSPGRERALNFAGVALLCAAWWLAVPEGNVFLPPLDEVLAETAALVRSGLLPRDAWASLSRVLPGIAVAFGLAALLAALSGLWRPLGHLLGGAVELFRPVPPIAWVPVAILLFGIGAKPAVAIVALGAFFPIWLGFQQGLSEVRGRHLMAARSFGAGRRILLTDVVIPSLAPYVLHGLRLGAGLGWFCVVAAEMMGAPSGLGYGVQLFSLNLELGRTYAYLLAIGLLGAGLNLAMRWLEQRLCGWHRRTVRGDDG